MFFLYFRVQILTTRRRDVADMVYMYIPRESLPGPGGWDALYRLKSVSGNPSHMYALAGLSWSQQQQNWSKNRQSHMKKECDLQKMDPTKKIKKQIWKKEVPKLKKKKSVKKITTKFGKKEEKKL